MARQAASWKRERVLCFTQRPAQESGKLKSSRTRLLSHRTRLLWVKITKQRTKRGTEDVRSPAREREGERKGGKGERESPSERDCVCAFRLREEGTLSAFFV